MFFDEETWITKLQQRKKASWHQDVIYVKALAKVLAWCLNKNISVTFVAESGGMYLSSEREISVSYRQSPESQLYTLLHEVGHFLVQNVPREKYIEKYPKGYLVARIDNESLQHRVDAVAEEFEAWWRGWRLAKRLNLLVDKRRYTRQRNRFLKSYFRWALEKCDVGRQQKPLIVSDDVQQNCK